jgi:hypothetical protein
LAAGLVPGFATHPLASASKNITRSTVCKSE